MEKVISIIVIVSMIFNFSDYSNFSIPDTAVSEYIESAKLFDLNKMSSKMNPSASMDKDKIIDLEGADENSLEKYILDYLKSNAKKITYKIKDTKIDNDKAVVTVDFKYVNGVPLLKAAMRDAYIQAISRGFTVVEMTDQETSQMLVSSMEKQKENIAESFVEKTIDIKCIKVDNQWYIDEPSDDLIDVIMSNLYTAVNQSFN